MLDALTFTLRPHDLSCQQCYAGGVGDDTLRRMLDLSGAPPALGDWIASIADDQEEAWDGCDKGDWLVWMAACTGLSLDDVLDAAYRAVRHALAQLAASGDGRLSAALDQMAQRGDHEGLCAAIGACEALSDASGTSYRSAPPPGWVSGARAAMHLGRAIEALDAALAQDLAIRTTEALSAATTIGVPPALMTRPQGTPLLVPRAIARDPIQQELAFVVASSAEAVEQAARALARDCEGDVLEDAEGELSDLMHDVLTPLWRDARLFA